MLTKVKFTTIYLYLIAIIILTSTYPVHAGCVGNELQCQRTNIIDILTTMSKLQIIGLVTVVVLVLWGIYYLIKKKN